jgi:uncharacterized protein (DUF2249 family)
MTTDIDLRDAAGTDVRSSLYDALDDAEPDDEFSIVADRDLDPDLVRYQLDREQAVAWTYDDPDEEPRELDLSIGAALDDFPTVDVRDLKPQRRHEALLAIFDDLDADGGFVLVNDHDPKPLYHELRSMHGEVVGWTYESEGGAEWRVAVEKTGASTAGDEDVVTRYDVREIPKQERHPTIHHRYGMLPDGGTMELIAPHEPRPLLREFRNRYGDGFEWEVVEEEPGEVRVHVTNLGAGSTDDGVSDAAGQAAEADRDHDHAHGDGHAHDHDHAHDHEHDHDNGHGHEQSAGADATAADGAGAADDEPSYDADVEIVEELDVRDRPPAQRHQAIFQKYAEVDAGEAFVLVNDHDPKPLYHQFEAEAGPEFRWEYLKQEPGEFRVLVGKAAGVATGANDAEQADPPF